MMHWLKPSYAALKLEISHDLSYRLKIFSWMLADILQPLIFAYLWSSVARYQGNVDQAVEVFSYFFFFMIVTRIAQDWSIFSVTDSIMNGEFGQHLLRPVNYMFMYGGRSAGLKLFRLAIFLPVALAISFAWRDRLIVDMNLERAIGLLFAIVIAIGANYMIGHIFALAAFYMENVRGIRTMFVNTLSLVTGEYIPIALLVSGVLLLIWEYLPFRYIYSFPVEILIGNVDRDGIFRGLLIGGAYLSFSVVFYKIFIKKALSRYETEGG
ncbi:MAG: ABC-2 family transporter protein [Candidatus Dojkabacteria bacterium]|nr:MAG: ABC-2 family transporter protein [Candidatus Dojkabacteria bacterium]